MERLNGLAIQAPFVRTPYRDQNSGYQFIFSPGQDLPFITALLPNDTIEIHNIETQEVVQIIPAPAQTPGTVSTERLNLTTSLHGYLVPSTQRLEKMRPKAVPLLRTLKTQPVTEKGVEHSLSENETMELISEMEAIISPPVEGYVL